jgi:anti-anti-sigma factor
MVHDWLRGPLGLLGQSTPWEAEVRAVLPDEYASSLLVDVEITDGTAVITVRGDLDITVNAALAGQLAEIMQKKPARLIFDLGSVKYMDCACARVLLSAARSLPEEQRPVIRSAGPLVRRLLAVTGLDTQCVLDSRCAAEASADGAGRFLPAAGSGAEPQVQADGGTGGSAPDLD